MVRFKGGTCIGLIPCVSVILTLAEKKLILAKPYDLFTCRHLLDQITQICELLPGVHTLISSA